MKFTITYKGKTFSETYTQAEINRLLLCVSHIEVKKVNE